MDKDITKELENHTFSQDYEICLNEAKKLSLFEQFSLANTLLANFQEWINENKSD